MPLELNEILKIALKGGASDIHLKSGLPPIFRVDGALVPLKNAERLLPDYLEKVAAGIMNPVQKERFESNRECDLAYGIAGLGRFRVNVFQQRGTVGIVFRVIPFGVKTIDQLVLPKVVESAALAGFREFRVKNGGVIAALNDIGQAFEGLQQPDSALAAYESFANQPDIGPAFRQYMMANTLRHLGELYEARNDKAKALEYYGRFAALWKNADAELQPQVQEVKKRMAVLAGEPRP